VPAPTPSWIETVRIQRDGEQQIVTVQTQSRLEYDIAMLDGGALVISAWRDANAAAAAVARADAVAAEEDPGAAQVAVKALPRPYEKPRIDRSTLTPSQRDERQAAEASTQLRAGQQSQAITLLRTALQSTDPAPRSAALLVTILMSQQRLQDAQPYLDRALQQMPQDATLVKLKARMLAMKGETERARNVLAPLSPATSSDPELLAMAASLAQQAHDFAAAAAYYLQWTHIDARSGAAWYGLALAFDAQASSSNAVSAYQHALSLISDARLRDYANTRIAALKGTSTPGNSNESVNTSAAVAR
jgi:tetratricopeptide (TPR) repeat protein